MSIYKLHKSFAASEDSAASLDIQFDGEITAIQWACSADFDADVEAYQIEASFLSSNSINNNDVRGSLGIVQERCAAAGTPANLVLSGINMAVTGLLIPVSQGERIHLHGNLTGTGSVIAVCYLFVNDRSDPRLRRRR